MISKKRGICSVEFSTEESKLGNDIGRRAKLKCAQQFYLQPLNLINRAVINYIWDDCKLALILR